MPITELSEHFTFAEATVSQEASRRGIDNSNIAPEVVTAMYRTATKMEKVRELLGEHPLHINSWYRCPELNAAIGSKPTSQHIRGEAVDFIAPMYGSPLEVCRTIIASTDLIRYDQLILEHTWVHISFCSPDVVPRKQVLSLLQTGGYASGLTSPTGAPL